MIKWLQHLLRPYGVVTLFGETPAEKRQKHIDKFQRNPKCRVFIGQIVAAGTGITLTAASEVMFVEASWNPAENAQAAMRAHRIGQTRPVRVRFMGLANSIDEKIQTVLRAKAKAIAEILD